MRNCHMPWKRLKLAKASASSGSTASCSIWACPPINWRTTSVGLASSQLGHLTCATTRPKQNRPGSFLSGLTKTNLSSCCELSAKSDSAGGLLDSWSPENRRGRYAHRGTWSKQLPSHFPKPLCARPENNRPRASSRRCESPSTRSWTICKRLWTSRCTNCCRPGDGWSSSPFTPWKIDWSKTHFGTKHDGRI